MPNSGQQRVDLTLALAQIAATLKAADCAKGDEPIHEPSHYITEAAGLIADAKRFLREQIPAQPAQAPNAPPNGARQQQGQGQRDEPSCPKCGGLMWDNRTTKRNPKAPDFKCRDRSCDGVVWPPKGAQSPNDR